MTNGEAVQTFQKLGLSEYESRALATLFGRHDSTALDISKEASIPYTKIYAVLTSLEKMGLVKCTLERPKKYRPIDPNSVVSAVLKNHEHRLEELRSVADNGLEDLKELFTAGEKYEGTEKVWFLNSLSVVWGTVKELTSNAKTSVHVVADNWIWKRGLLDEKFGKIVSRRVVGGLECHGIVPVSLSLHFMNPKNISKAWLPALAHKNFSIRLIDDDRIHHNVFMTDNEGVGFSFKDIETKEIFSGVYIIDKSVSQGTLDYFNMLWDQAMPVENKIRAAAKVALVVTGGRRKKTAVS